MRQYQSERMLEQKAGTWCNVVIYNNCLLIGEAGGQSFHSSLTQVKMADYGLMRSLSCKSYGFESLNC